MRQQRFTVRRRHNRRTERGLVPVRRHPMAYWSFGKQGHYTEIAGWRKGKGLKLGKKAGGVRMSRKFNAGSVLERLNAGENVRLTEEQKKGIEAFMQKQLEQKESKEREKIAYKKLVKEGKAW